MIADSPRCCHRRRPHIGRNRCSVGIRRERGDRARAALRKEAEPAVLRQRRRIQLPNVITQSEKLFL